MNALLRSSRLRRHGKTATGKGQTTATPRSGKTVTGSNKTRTSGRQPRGAHGGGNYLGGLSATTYACFVYLSWVFPHGISIVHVYIAVARELVRQEARCQSLGGLGLKSLSTVEAIT